MAVGLFGGAFNPPHVSHLLAVTYALTMDPRVGKVVIVPSVRHPWKPDMQTPLEHRAAMLALLFQPLESLAIGIDDEIEMQIAADKPLGDPVYTIDVVERYVSLDRKVVLVVGQDEAENLPRWYRYDDLIRLAGPPCVVPRGCTKNVRVPDMSSTAIRELLVHGKFEDAAAYTPRSVLNYIEAHRLYMTSKWARTRN